MKILFIDDSADYRFLLDKWLQNNNLNYEYVICESVNKAKKCILKDNFDLILCDLLMPENSGITMLEFMKDTNLSTPIAIMSVLREEDYPILGFDIKHRYEKPIYFSDLLKVINNMISCSSVKT